MIRKAALNGLHRSSELPPTPSVVVLTGIGGQGKSQTALRYCHLTRGYHAKFWINASSRETTVRSFEAIAAELARKPLQRAAQSPASGGRDDGLLITWDRVAGKLATWDRPWLLVFDNYDDVKSFPIADVGTAKDPPAPFTRLIDFFPASRYCHAHFLGD
jgi:hypothetical protein